jgi:hypothetical protein
VPERFTTGDELEPRLPPCPNVLMAETHISAIVKISFRIFA